MYRSAIRRVIASMLVAVGVALLGFQPGFQHSHHVDPQAQKHTHSQSDRSPYFHSHRGATNRDNETADSSRLISTVSHAHVSFFGWELTLFCVKAEAQMCQHRSRPDEDGLARLLARVLELRSPLPPRGECLDEWQAYEFLHVSLLVDEGRDRESPQSPPPQWMVV